MERRVQSAVRAAVGAGLATAAHDCAEGGVAVTLAESAVTGATPFGCDVTVPEATRADLAFFGEGPSRVVVTVEPARVREFEALMAESAIPWRWIGVTGGERVVIRTTSRVIDVAVESLAHAWRSGFERHMA
jgi:phosphoribosylformylglycinamidine synthase